MSDVLRDEVIDAQAHRPGAAILIMALEVDHVFARTIFEIAWGVSEIDACFGLTQAYILRMEAWGQKIPRCATKSLARLRCFMAFMLGVSTLCPSAFLHAQQDVDVVTYFQRAHDTRGAGLARKTKPVDVRPAKPGEVIVTTIKGEGKETQSPPAKPGDMVVRNRCPETGNEEILVAADAFPRRYEGPIGSGTADGWLPYRPRGIQMRFVVVAEQDGEFSFIAPWGEKMVARPGDAIVQDPDNAKDTYRVAKAAFACTYEVVREPQR